MSEQFKRNLLIPIIEQYPEDFKYAEDIINFFTKGKTIKTTAWDLLPSKIMGKKPNNVRIKYNQALAVYKKGGMANVIQLAKYNSYPEYDSCHAILAYPEAATSFKTITNLDPRTYWSKLWYWRGIKRGEDLFVKGLGTFNIVDALSKVSSPAPVNIRCMGYFGRDDHAIMDVFKKSGPMLEHFIRFKQQWTPELLARIDEVTRYLDLVTYNYLPETCIDDMRPNALLGFCEEEYNKYLSLRDQPKNLPYDLKGAEKLNMKNGHTLIPISNHEELMAVNQQHQTCIGTYHGRLAVGACQLWSLFKGTDLVGVGELIKRNNALIWYQIRGKRNIKLHQEYVEMYNSVLPTLTKTVQL